MILYCNSLTEYSRFLTSEVKIGDVPLGGNHPIRVQSMTTTDTMDTIATVEQSIRIIEAGGEYVRITAPSINDAKNLENIKNELRKRGYKTPLIADIHFTPNAAETAARIVEKVRVNPGNYADRKKFEVKEYTDDLYAAELERIRERFTPLVKICKEYGTAMRIGTNHGSLSDRIMSRYGDTPLGMVESALEFVRICEENNYYEIVLSMKASNPQVMVQAYRLLVSKMKEEGMNYPLHLGVTEAGEGEDGRIKSAAGIGTLLEDGMGDTIRVSLTEDPELEIPVARKIAERYSKRGSQKSEVRSQKPAPITIGVNYSPYEYSRRETHAVLNFGNHNVPRVITDLSNKEKISPASFFPFGYNYSASLDKWNISDQACDYIYVGNNAVDFEIPGTLGLIFNYDKWKTLASHERCYPLMNEKQFINTDSEKVCFVTVSAEKISETFFDKLGENDKTILILDSNDEVTMPRLRGIFNLIIGKKIFNPVVIKRNYNDGDEEKLTLKAATDLGGLFIDGMGDGVWLNGSGKIPAQSINRISFGILQAARTRISKTEYISCPSCGRTLFDLQETTAKIRSRTDHLKGVKIAIMGCIVNGPGEMADADYGYVGSGPGKITLYKGKEIVRRNIETSKAVDELIDLIKENGDWVEVSQQPLISI